MKISDEERDRILDQYDGGNCVHCGWGYLERKGDVLVCDHFLLEWYVDDDGDVVAEVYTE